MPIYWLWGKDSGRPENLNFVSSDQPTEGKDFQIHIDVPEKVYGSLESNVIDTKSGDDVIIGDVSRDGIREIELGAADVLSGGRERTGSTAAAAMTRSTVVRTP